MSSITSQAVNAATVPLLFLLVFLLLLLCGCWCFLSLRRKGTTSSPQMVVWNKQNPLEEHLSLPLNEARSSSSSSSNQSEHSVTRTGSSPLAVPGRRWVTSNNSIIQSKFACYLVFLHTINFINANFGWSPHSMVLSPPHSTSTTTCGKDLVSSSMCIYFKSEWKNDATLFCILNTAVCRCLHVYMYDF